LTTLHAGVLAAIFSQSGQFFPPYLIDDAKSILGLGFYRHAARPQQLLADDLNFLRVRKAMAAVVEDEEGTGRRAFNETIRLAIKTGTASNPAGGLDAIIAGFFPGEKPRYAFAFRLEGGGRADVNGAYFLRDLVRILYPN
jgi:peptidoglycan glycosyltransferase